MYLVLKRPTKGHSSREGERLPSCLYVHMYNMQGTPRTSSYAPIVLVIEDTEDIACFLMTSLELP